MGLHGNPEEQWGFPNCPITMQPAPAIKPSEAGKGDEGKLACQQRKSKLLASPVLTHIILLYIIPYIRSLDPKPYVIPYIAHLCEEFRIQLTLPRQERYLGPILSPVSSTCTWSLPAFGFIVRV